MDYASPTEILHTEAQPTAERSKAAAMDDLPEDLSSLTASLCTLAMRCAV